MRMPFGKYRGLDISDLPDGYLQWLLENISLREPLLSAVQDEIAMRQTPAGPVADAAGEIISTGYRVLAMKNHPDKGGDTATMQSINIAATWLRGQLRGLLQ